MSVHRRRPNFDKIVKSNANGQEEVADCYRFHRLRFRSIQNSDVKQLYEQVNRVRHAFQKLQDDVIGFVGRLQTRHWQWPDRCE